MKIRHSLKVVCLFAVLGAFGCVNQGEEGQSAVVEAEPAGTNCEFGGVRVSVGGGEPTYVCHGATGEAGEAGAAGEAGPQGPQGETGAAGEAGTAPTITVERVDADGTDQSEHDCEFGGVKVTVDDQSGDDPVVEYLCDNPPAAAPEISVADAGDACGDAGGIVVTVEGTEHPICNGENGLVGERGGDGISPTVTVTTLDAGDMSHDCAPNGGYRITIEDASGTQSFDLCHGEGDADAEPGPLFYWSFDGADPMQADIGEGTFWHSSMYDGSGNFVANNDSLIWDLGEGDKAFGASNWEGLEYYDYTSFNFEVNSQGYTFTTLEFYSYIDADGPIEFELCYEVSTLECLPELQGFDLGPAGTWQFVSIDLADVDFGPLTSYQGHVGDVRFFLTGFDSTSASGVWYVNDVRLSGGLAP